MNGLSSESKKYPTSYKFIINCQYFICLCISPIGVIWFVLLRHLGEWFD